MAAGLVRPGQPHDGATLTMSETKSARDGVVTLWRDHDQAIVGCRAQECKGTGLFMKRTSHESR